ncbi:type I-E CRISPR-associated protein Cas7/Cse4/CasC [Methylicorpusculum sp.]|uniref:type I-E CRISPR-associated protein Cas7/Cse4/CasC n=1 Tax=Methylicorpusculum sp. TaxID=2713644 RepID=UPI0027181B18|nr:type I-E CRISPR-associated protein Cas7/Cse4/CasC [Methylicorpusculum sp.]MDO8843403.1 type I-E CRISPR-associated protein Cas7/Cse4/CasC [Methylicorpusculum sp.]
MNENFINFHILISHSPSCLNRDDMNMQKSALFGGKRRVRVSSQSLKRTMRHSDYYREHLGEPSIRTKHLADYQNKAVAALSNRYNEDLIKQAIDYISGKDASAEDAKDDAVAPWVLEEVAYFCDQIKLLEAEGVDAKKLQKHIEKDSQAFRQALSKGLDIALSGRMATSGLMSEVGKIDGALAVAHAITTHTVDADIDWFTAVDDLQELGSGHLDTQEFSSGVFYRYASLNLKQLQVNLGLLADIKTEETAEGRAKALGIAAHVLHMLATEVPSAKQQSFAAHNLADLALVGFSHQPVSLANAFEKPIQADFKTGGFREPSITALNTYWDKIHRGYGLQERCAEFVLEQVQPVDGIVVKPSLPELVNWVKTNGQG